MRHHEKHQLIIKLYTPWYSLVSSTLFVLTIVQWSQCHFLHEQTCPTRITLSEGKKPGVGLCLLGKDHVHEKHKAWLHSLKFQFKKRARFFHTKGSYSCFREKFWMEKFDNQKVTNDGNAKRFLPWSLLFQMPKICSSSNE